jgi:glycosyltransferase involved in cell wall biosynthesis
MKKLIFLVHFANISSSSGIIEKIITQSKYMDKEGMLYKTYIMCKKADAHNIEKYNHYPFLQVIPLDFYTNEKNPLKKMVMLGKIYRTYRDICLKEKGNYDYIYIRYNPLYFGFVKFVYHFKKKFIFEHNSIELSEYKANKSFTNVIRSLVFDKLVRKCAAGYIAVSTQIYDYQQKRYNGLNGVAGALIPNGVDCFKYNVRKAPSYDGKHLNLIFVGNIRYWHGIERIINAINNYKGKVKVRLDIYGPIKQDGYLSPIIGKGKVKDCVRFLGYKSSEELDEAFKMPILR